MLEPTLLFPCVVTSRRRYRASTCIHLSNLQTVTDSMTKGDPVWSDPTVQYEEGDRLDQETDNTMPQPICGQILYLVGRGEGE